jgi:hypothetical protein
VRLFRDSTLGTRSTTKNVGALRYTYAQYARPCVATYRVCARVSRPPARPGAGAERQAEKRANFVSSPLARTTVQP